MLFERVEQRSDTVSLEKLAVAARARYRTRESGAEQRMVINYKDFVAHCPVRMRPEASRFARAIVLLRRVDCDTILMLRVMSIE
jgi:hypothetical protein